MRCCLTLSVQHTFHKIVHLVDKADTKAIKPRKPGQIISPRLVMGSSGLTESHDEHRECLELLPEI